MRRALLDVNVLLALLDSDHVEHATAWAWFDSALEGGWASCPITENGFVRVISQPRYPSPIPPAQAIALLDSARAGGLHAFWPCDISVLDSDMVDPFRVHGSRQLTDAYLLALAVAHDGHLVSFDRTLPLSAVPAATAADLVVL